MTVYVYQFAGQRPKLFTAARPNPWYGLTADSTEELHAFAESLGFSRDFYRPLRSNGQELPLPGHYELRLAERNRAISSGAQTLTTRAHRKSLREQEATFGFKLD